MKYLETLLKNLTDGLPGVIGALIILVIGLLLAAGVRKLLLRTLKALKLDERLGGKVKLAEPISKLGYYVIVIFTLTVVLNRLGIQGVLVPLQNMLNTFLQYVPNIIAAALIGYVGYMLASLASQTVEGLGNALQKFTKKVNFGGNFDLLKILKRIVFLLIFIPILIAALDSLQIDIISKPAKELLENLMLAVPKILASAIIIAIAYLGGRYLIAIIAEFLQNLGVDKFSEKVGISKLIGEKNSLTKIICNIVFFYLMFGAIISAAEKLEFTGISLVLNQVLLTTGQIIFGLIILMVGNLVANFIEQNFTNDENKGLMKIAKFAILGLFVGIALKSMGIADSIVNMAFGLTLGAIAVAVALSFGLGGREAAGVQMDHILKQFRKDKDEKSKPSEEGQ